MMAHVLRASDKDTAIGFNHPYQKIKEFYKGCLQLGDKYKRDEKVTITKGKENGITSPLGTLSSFVAYAKCNRDSYEIFLALIQVMHMELCYDANQAARKHSKPA
ncbi:hypothetical protein Tco_1000011 [Tanacetum coccineum]